eukprot:TRINITY_DN6070_c0_g1_i1.p1 TRINITY_DN6070_c0_g1~~TRINITY_DN6070_c0_g1_i1.p1  ORF type:complete len:216 (-),score=34.08 TRINITY_DN6070_c0_g1_i1:395-1042(-)
MSSFLKPKHHPIVLIDELYYFLFSIPEYINIQRKVSIPRIPDSNVYIYSLDLLNSMFHVLACLENSIMRDSCVVFKKNVLTEKLLGTMVERGGLEWGLYYDDKHIDKQKLGKEVSLKNLQKLYKHVVEYNIEFTERLSQYINFIEEEKRYLKDVEYNLRHSTPISNMTDESFCTKDEKLFNVVLPRDDDLQRAKNIEEIIRNKKDEDNINYNDYW